MESRICPTCGRRYQPNKPQQRFCRRNCGRWKHHTAIKERTSHRAPRDEWEAHLAGLIATDGYVERRKSRPEPTGVAIKMAVAAQPMLLEIANHYGRRLCARANGQFVLSFTDIPVRWKLELPDLASDLVRHYVRGLLDGDGCFSAARAAGRAYPYLWLCFNPQREPWIGEFYCGFLDELGASWTRQDERPTVAQIRCWSLEARRVAEHVYRGDRPAHTEKARRAREICQRYDATAETPGWPLDLYRGA